LKRIEGENKEDSHQEILIVVVEVKIVYREIERVVIDQYHELYELYELLLLN